MRLINFNPKTREFKSTVTETISKEELDTLQVIKNNKEPINWNLLGETMGVGNEDDGSRLSLQIGIVHNLKDIGLIEETHIIKEGKLADWAYKLSDTGKALLTIIEKQKTK